MKRASGIILLVLLASSILPSLVYPVTAVYHPRNLNEAILAGFQGIIEPDNPTVQQKLHFLCPTIDRQHITANLLAIYKYSSTIQYANDSTTNGVPEYWQTAEETIQLGHGDCEDHAINLATLIEALYKQTYLSIPLNLVWVAQVMLRDMLELVTLMEATDGLYLMKVSFQVKQSTK